MPATNVELSKNEMELVVNSEFILTKNRIVEKVFTLFGSLSEDYKTIAQSLNRELSDITNSPAAKIYRGENYLNLPYVMMDYPRIFLKQDVLAVRSFFWWGNYFSCTLQLSGKFLANYKNKLAVNLPQKQYDHFFVGVNESPWHHHFETTNYKALHETDIASALSKPFFKIAVKLPLSKWNESEAFFTKNYTEFLGLLTQ